MKEYSKRETIQFILYTFAGSYLCWGLLLVLKQQENLRNLYDQLYSILYILGGFFPSIIAIGMTYRKKKSLKPLTDKLKYKIQIPYLVFIFTSTLLILFLPKVICDLLGNPVTITMQQRFFKNGSFIQFLFYFVAVTLCGGGVNEEFGWRGYLLPGLMQTHNRLTSGIYIGIVWTCWHIPLFFIAPENYLVGSFNLAGSLFLYLLETIWLSLIFVWLFDKTKQSLLAVILFHGMDNTILSTFRIDCPAGNPFYIIQTIIRVVFLTVILIGWHREAKRKRLCLS